MYEALETYAFIAVTPTKSTLDHLIQIVKEETDERQQSMDVIGCARPRDLDVSRALYPPPPPPDLARLVWSQLHPECGVRACGAPP